MKPQTQNTLAIASHEDQFSRALTQEEVEQAMRFAERAYTLGDIDVSVLHQLSEKYADRVGSVGREFQTRVCDEPNRPAFENVWSRKSSRGLHLH